LTFGFTFYKRRINEGINEGLNEGLNGGINGGINRLYDYIEGHPGQRITEMSIELNIPGKTLERWIRSLKEQGKIIFKGSKKTGGYFRI
jgi:ATP-dependent DNA helicase RecG